MVGENEVKDLWERYQEKKKMAKDLVRKKRREERDVLFKECIGKGGCCSAKFWEKAKSRASKASKSLKDKKGKLHREEVSMAEIAREHFESVGKGLSRQDQGRKEDPTEESSQLDQTKEPFPELQAPISLEEVKEAIKGMKRGKGVGCDKISLEMIQGEGRFCCEIYIEYSNVAGRRNIFQKKGWKG